MRNPAGGAPSAGQLLLGVAAAIVGGSFLSAQSRVNGELGQAMGDPYAAALVSFGSGLVLCVIGVAVIPAGRRGVARLPGLLRSRRIPWWYLLAGAFGSFLVAVQTQVTVRLGVSVFILGIVVGQAVGGLVVDRVGIGPAGPKRLTAFRLGGTALIIGAVVVAMLPRITQRPEGATLPVVLAMILLPVLAGVLTAVQTAWNGEIAAQARTPIVSTLTNFAAGTIALAITSVVVTVLRDQPLWRWPAQWWLYIGGALGIVVVTAGAVLAKRIGVLLTGLGLVTGMLLGALALDILIPTPTTVVTPVTVVGTLLTIGGLVVATLPWRGPRA